MLQEVISDLEFEIKYAREDEEELFIERISRIINRYKKQKKTIKEESVGVSNYFSDIPEYNEENLSLFTKDPQSFLDSIHLTRNKSNEIKTD